MRASRTSWWKSESTLCKVERLVLGTIYVSYVGSVVGNAYRHGAYLQYINDSRCRYVSHLIQTSICGIDLHKSIRVRHIRVGGWWNATNVFGASFHRVKQSSTQDVYQNYFIHGYAVLSSICYASRRGEFCIWLAWGMHWRWATVGMSNVTVYRCLIR